jgi:TusA-related sulfurtransferase
MSEIPAHTGKSDPSPDAVLEMLGTDSQSVSTCALLTPAIKAKLRELRSGQVLEVRVDDLTAHADIVSWCRLTGHELLAVSEDTPHQLRCYIRKKSY